jgi:hypothetical protein
MRTFFLGLVLIMVTAFNQNISNHSYAGQHAGTGSPAARYSHADTLESGDSLRNPYHHSYLTDLQIHEIALLYLSDSIIPLDNHITFHLMDTLITCAAEDRDWFMSIFELILMKADGALAEAVGFYTWKFIRKHPGYFTAYADTADPGIISKWALFTSYEMYAAVPEDSLDFYSDQMMNDLKKHIDTENNGLTGFEKELSSYIESLFEG